jgi:hypothetical protein
MMDFLRLSHREDFGHDFYFQFINFSKHFPQPFKRRSLLQFSVSWNDYASWPYIQFTMGSGGLLGVIIWIYKFGFDADLFRYTWKFDHLPGTSK